MNTPRRIVSLISSATEILYLLGLGERVVGVSHECDYPAEVAAKPRLTRSLVEASAPSGAIDEQVRTLSAEQAALYTIDVERLAELRPDLIVTQAQCDVCAVRYEDVVTAVRETPALHGTPVLALNPSRLSDVFEDVARIGEATGTAAVAREAVAALKSRVERVQFKTRNLAPEQRPRVACLEWIEPPMLAANWTPELVDWAGAASGQVSGRHSAYADWNQIAQFDPQIVVIMPCGFDLPRAIVEAQVLPGVPQWSQLSAVREGLVFAVDGNAYFNRSGPRLVDSLEILAHLFHPELFQPPKIEPIRPWCRLVARGTALVAEEA